MIAVLNLALKGAGVLNLVRREAGVLNFDQTETGVLNLALIKVGVLNLVRAGVQNTSDTGRGGRSLGPHLLKTDQREWSGRTLGC